MDINSINQGLAVDRVKNLGGRADDTAKDKALKDACQGFEAMWINSMVQAMRTSLPGNALFPETNESDIFQSLSDQYLSDELAQGDNSLGFKEYLYEQLRDDI